MVGNSQEMWPFLCTINKLNQLNSSLSFRNFFAILLALALVTYYFTAINPLCVPFCPLHIDPNMASRELWSLVIFLPKNIWIFGCFGSLSVKTHGKNENAMTGIQTGISGLPSKIDWRCLKMYHTIMQITLWYPYLVHKL